MGAPEERIQRGRQKEGLLFERTHLVAVFNGHHVNGFGHLEGQTTHIIFGERIRLGQTGFDLMPSRPESGRFPFEGTRLTGPAREARVGDRLAVQEPAHRVIHDRLVAEIGDGQEEWLLGVGRKPQVGEGDIGSHGRPHPHESNREPARQGIAVEPLGSGPLEIADDDDGSRAG